MLVGWILLRDRAVVALGALWLSLLAQAVIFPRVVELLLLLVMELPEVLCI
jgi:hypothetical protein